MSEEIKTALKQIIDNSELTTPDVSKKLLVTAIHAELNGLWGNTLESNFNSALSDLKGKLIDSPVKLSDIDLRHIIGQEISWNLKVSNDCFTHVADLEKARNDFLSFCVGDVDPLHNDGSIESRLNELDMFLESCSHVSPFRFGIPKLDEAMGFVPPGNICVLTGAPGTMKTSLALSAVEDFITNTQNDIAYYCSIDMIPRDITLRIIERESGISETRLKMLRETNFNEYINLAKQHTSKYSKRLVIQGHEPRRMDINKLLNDCLRRNPRLVVIDYFTALKAFGQSDLEFVEDAMRRILEFTHRYHTTFLILSQMSRSSRSDQGSGRVGGHGKGGGIVEELADVEIELIKQPSEEDSSPDLIIAALTKSRHGQSNKFFSLDYQGAIKRFTGKATKMRKNSNKKSLFVSGNGGGFYDDVLKK